MIKNRRLTRDQRAGSLGVAEKALATSRANVRAGKRRSRRLRVAQDEEDDAGVDKQTWTEEEVREFWNRQDVPSGVPRPEGIPAVQQETIAALEPDLGHVPVADLILALQTLSGEYKIWGSVAEIEVEPPQSALPEELDLIVDDYGLSTCPTHYFAVYSSNSPQSPRRPRTASIYPAQAFILALYCSALHQFPVSEPKVEAASGETVKLCSDSDETIIIETSVLRLPIVHVCIPHPKSFPLLFAYFHNNNQRELTFNLLPVRFPLPNGHNEQDYCAAFASDVAEQLSPSKLFGCMETIQGVWSNMIALGITNEQLWLTLGKAWDTAEAARQLQMATPQCVQQPPSLAEKDNDTLPSLEHVTLPVIW